MIEADGTGSRRLTDNDDGDGFPALSPDGRRVVFESNRRRSDGEPLNVAELFLMDADGSNQRVLTRGSSAAWSPNGESIVYHASSLSPA